MRYLRKTMLRLVLLTFLLFAGSIWTGTGAEPVSAGSGYSVDGNTITVDVDSAPSVWDAIDNALDYARMNYQAGRIFTVKVPAGNYSLKSTLHIFGNTTLDLTGVTLTYTKNSGNMIMLGRPESNKNIATMGGYGTIANITVKGGTWMGNNSNSSSLIRMAHAKNVTFDGCIISGGGCAHQMEIAAIDGFTIKNCKLMEMPGNESTGKQEALQFDMPCSTYVFSGIILDGTPMKNVLVTGCTFENVPRGLGTHNMLIGRYHTDIKITDNIFRNVDGECIVALNYRNCDIKDNMIVNCGAGIVFEYFKPPVNDNTAIKAVYTTIFDGTQEINPQRMPDANTYISNNIIALSEDRYADEYTGIRVYGYELEQDKQATGNGSDDIIPADNYYISNVNIIGNTIKTCGYGIHLSDVRNSAVSGNKITNTYADSWEDGITVDASSQNIMIQKNEIKNATRHGIFIEDFSSAKTISENKITGGDYYGINIYDNSKVTGYIEKNTIKGCADNGIHLSGYCSAKGIRNNTISSTGWHGINLYDNSTVNGSITGNKVSKCIQNGIFINKESAANSVTKNTLTENKKYAIALYDGSSVTGNISSNKISKNQMHAIQLSENCSADGIKYNTISNTKGKGILIRDDSTVESMIGYNKITTATQEGIYIYSTKNALAIKGNTIKKCSRTPIAINTSSKQKITVTKNSITVKKGKDKLLVVKGKVKSDIKKPKDKDKKDKKDKN